MMGGAPDSDPLAETDPPNGRIRLDSAQDPADRRLVPSQGGPG
jgi:hypothetical protein